jgi:hypothetical protein
MVTIPESGVPETTKSAPVMRLPIGASTHVPRKPDEVGKAPVPS